MSLCITCNEAQPRSVLSNVTTTVVAVITAMTFSASGAAPTPLYHHYQESFGLTPFAITIIFAAYVVSLLAALLTVGSLSDYIGRRPAILAALILNAVAMAIFMTADSAAALVAARALQGFATGLATATLGAATLFLLDRALLPTPMAPEVTQQLRIPIRVASRDAGSQSTDIPVEQADPQVWYRYIQELIYAGDREQAERHLRRFNQLHPDFVYRP